MTLAGSDFSKSRLAAAHRHFGPKLNGINLTVRSLNETAAVTEHYDMIFTVGALLFTGTNVDRSVRHLCEMTKRRLVLVEPTWEYALAHQRLYLLRAGYSVSILPAVKDTGLPIVRSESASCDFSIMLPASVIVVDCEQKEW